MQKLLVIALLVLGLTSVAFADCQSSHLNISNKTSHGIWYHEGAVSAKSHLNQIAARGSKHKIIWTSVNHFRLYNKDKAEDSNRICKVSVDEHYYTACTVNVTVHQQGSVIACMVTTFKRLLREKFNL